MAAREALIHALGAFTDLVESPAVVRAWSGPSALDDYELGALVGHVLSSVGAVERYLDAPVGPGAAADRLAYYRAVQDLPDQAELHAGVRARGAALAATGHPAVVGELRALTGRLGSRLAGEPVDRLVTVFGGLTLGLDDYLETRLVEVCVHHDDVATSVGLEPLIPADALDLAVGLLVDTARDRHGDVGVLRALARRERDTADALRVL